jgi:hypothetical protein
MKVQAKLSDIIALATVILMSVTANLTERFMGDVVNKKILLIALTAAVVIALFRHLRFLLFLTIATLAIGANLPEGLASALGLSPLVMIIAMALIVVIGLLNYAFKLLPTGIEKRRLDTIESRKAVLAAVTKGDVVNLHRLLAMNVEINFVHDGTAPILIAAENGYADIMQILVHQGAKVRVQNAEGKMPMEIALTKGFTRTAEIINHASEADLAQSKLARAASDKVA